MGRSCRAKKHKDQIRAFSSTFQIQSFFKSADHDVRFTLIGLKTFPNGSDDCFLMQASTWASVYEIEIDFVDGVSFCRVEGWVVSKQGQSCNDLIASFTELEGK